MSEPIEEMSVMSFGDHLDELRKRLILGLLGPLALTIFCFFFGEVLLNIFCLPLRETQKALGMPQQLYVFTAQGGFVIYFKVALICGISLGMPWLIYQLWKFIAAGLYAHERKFAVMLFPGSMFLAITGICFMYFVMLPIMLFFLLNFSGQIKPPTDDSVTKPISKYFGFVLGTSPDEDKLTVGEYEVPKMPVLLEAPKELEEGSMWIDAQTQQVKVMLNGQINSIPLIRPSLMAPMMQVDQYIGFVFWLTIAFSISFQLPLVMLLLAFVDIVRIEVMTRYWKYATLAIVVLSAILTPQDPASMVLLAIPLVGLYWLGVFLVKIFVKFENDEDQEEAIY